jgi:hypothetical protein
MTHEEAINRLHNLKDWVKERAASDPIMAQMFDDLIQRVITDLDVEPKAKLREVPK